MEKANIILLLLGFAAICVGSSLFFFGNSGRATHRVKSPSFYQESQQSLFTMIMRLRRVPIPLSPPILPVPRDAFRRASTAATHEDGHPSWKGSSLAILTLSDGTQRRARFSYYGGVFTIDGTSGHFVVPDGDASGFQRLHLQLIHERFVPRRFERNKTRNAAP
jgi:hypothetical protein